MKASNWPGAVDYGHPNHTLKTPRVSRYDGMGAWEKDSSKIPLTAWLWAAVFVAAMVAMMFVGAATGY